MSEQKKAMCPQGHEMKIVAPKSPDNFGVFIAGYVCDCGWQSPRERNNDREKAIAAAYLAATRRPPNKPLTLPELFDLDPESDAVWIYDSSWEKPIRAMSAEEACEWASDADTVLFFGFKPTAADIEAARSRQ